MSMVTGIVLCTSCIEPTTNLALVNAWFVSEGFPALVHVDESMCTGKHPQMRVLGGAMNYFGGRVTTLRRFIQDLPWRSPENVILIIQGEETPTEVARPPFKCPHCHQYVCVCGVKG